MLDPTALIPERLKETLANTVFELLAGSAERLGGHDLARNIRKLSSRAELLQSLDCAFVAGVARFLDEYTSQDEDLTAAIRNEEIFWQSEVVQEALVSLVSRPGAWMRQDRETVLRHFETVLPMRVNRDRVDKAVSFLLLCIAEEIWSLPGAHEIREAYAIQFQELSAQAQVRQVELARQQLQATTQLSTDLRQVLLQLIGLVEQRVLEVPPHSPPLPSPRPYCNLPRPTYTEFVGREKELAWLREQLSSQSRAWQIAITGIGGVGKSALALAIAHEFVTRYPDSEPSERFEAIIWVSAQEEVLTVYGPVRAGIPQQVLHTLEDVYTTIADVLDRDDIPSAEPHEQSALVDKLLRSERILLVMDNLESLKDDRIKAFLRMLPPPAKAVVTSRERLTDNTSEWQLTGLSFENAQLLIAEQCRNGAVVLTVRQQQRLFDLTSGLPLPIKLGIARLAIGQPFAEVERWLGDATGELPEYCIKGQVNLVQEVYPDAWSVLLACALFDRGAGASRDSLGIISDLSIADREQSLLQLRRLNLVNQNEQGRLWVLPIVQRFASAAFGAPGKNQALVERWFAYLADYALECSRLADEDMSKMLLLGQEYPNLRIAIARCSDSERLPMLLRLCEGTWLYPYRFALLNDLEEILKVWLGAAIALKNALSEARAKLQLARLYQIRRRYDESGALLDQVELTLEKDGAYRDLAEAWATRCIVLSSPDEVLQAREIAQRIYNLGIELQDPDIASQGAQRLSGQARRAGDYDEALHWSEEAEVRARKSGSSRRLASALGSHARTLALKGNYGAAEMRLKEALQINEQFSARRHMLYDKAQLAEVYAATGQLSLAQRFAREACDLIERISMSDEFKDISESLNRILTS